MQFHARLAPGTVTDPDQVVDLVIHTPSKAEGVTIKVWELDVFRDPETGQRVQEGTQDDLLAEFTGSIEPGDPDRSKPGWRRFVVASARIVSDDPELARFKLRLCGGQEVHEIPIVSEAGEAEGTSFELGLSIEHEGQERYRTSVPCLFSPPRVQPVVVRRRVSGYLEDGAPDPRWVNEARLSLKYVAFGVAEGEPGERGLGQRLKVLLRGYVDVHGHLVRRPDEAGPDDAALVSLRAGRRLFAYVHDDPDAAPLGSTRIPIAVCEEVAPSGQVVREEGGGRFDLESVFSLGALSGGAEVDPGTSTRPRSLGAPLVIDVAPAREEA